MPIFFLTVKPQCIVKLLSAWLMASFNDQYQQFVHMGNNENLRFLHFFLLIFFSSVFYFLKEDSTLLPLVLIERFFWSRVHFCYFVTYCSHAPV